jgi:DNA polymerase phi
MPIVSDEEKRDDVHGINARRAWIIDQLGALIRNGTIPKSDQWIQAILDWLIVNGLFIIKRKSEKSPYRAVSAAYIVV